MIAPAKHPLVTEKNIPLTHFAKENFVVRELGSGTRGATQRLLGQHDVNFNTGIEVTSKLLQFGRNFCVFFPITQILSNSSN